MKTILAKLPFLTVAALLVVAALSVPAFAADDGADVDSGQVDDAEADLPADDVEEEAASDNAIAETPRDRLGLLLFGAMGAAGVAAWIGMRRQLSGDRPTADGEFRWR